MNTKLMLNICLTILLFTSVHSKCQLVIDFVDDIWIKTFEGISKPYGVGSPDFQISEVPSVKEGEDPVYIIYYIPLVKGIVFLKKDSEGDILNVEPGDYVRFFYEYQHLILGITPQLPSGLTTIDELMEVMDKNDKIQKKFELAPYVPIEGVETIELFHEFLSHKEVVKTYKALNNFEDDQDLIQFPDLSFDFEGILKNDAENRNIKMIILISEIVKNIVSPLFLNFVEPESELHNGLRAALKNLAIDLIQSVDWFKNYSGQLNFDMLKELVNVALEVKLNNNLLLQTLQQKIYSEDTELSIKFPEVIELKEKVDGEEEDEDVETLKYKPFVLDDNMTITVKSIMTAFRRYVYTLWGRSNRYVMEAELSQTIIDKVYDFGLQVLALPISEKQKNFFEDQIDKAAKLMQMNLNPQRLEIGFWLEFNKKNFAQFFLQYTQITYEREIFRKSFIDEDNEIPLDRIKLFLTYNHPEEYLDHSTTKARNKIKSVRFIDKKRNILI